MNDNIERKEDIEVYKTLRNSIIRSEDSIINATIYMYVVYFALLTLGFSYNLLFYGTFVVLIVFQTIINDEKIAVERAAAYIRVFFEDTHDYNIHWETLNKDTAFLHKYGKLYRNVSWQIKSYSATLLALLSFVIIVAAKYNRIWDYETNSIKLIILFELGLAVLLLGFVFIVNKRQYYNKITGDHRADELMHILQDFHNKCYKTSKKHSNNSAINKQNNN